MSELTKNTLEKSNVNLMKRLRVAVGSLTLLTAAAATAQAQPPTTTTFVAKGEGAYAQTFSFDEAGVVSITIDVSRGGTPSSPTTFLYYDVFIGTSNGGIARQGMGVIPNADFSSNGRTVILNTDTSVIPGFELIAGAGGPINLHWEATPRDCSIRSDGSWESWGGGIRQRSVGHYRSACAVPQGDVFGEPIPAGAFGEVRKSFGVDKTFERVP